MNACGVQWPLILVLIQTLCFKNNFSRDINIFKLCEKRELKIQKKLVVFFQVSNYMAQSNIKSKWYELKFSWIYLRKVVIKFQCMCCSAVYFFLSNTEHNLRSKDSEIPKLISTKRNKSLQADNMLPAHQIQISLQLCNLKGFLL